MRYAIKKFFTTSPTEGGSIRGYVSVKNQDEDSPKAPKLDAEFIMTDCSDQISLEFDIGYFPQEKTWGEKVKQRRQKIKNLRKFVNEYCDKYEEALDTYAKVVKERGLK